MDALSRASAALFAILLVSAAWTGCGGADGARDPRRVSAQAPALPEGVLVQLFVPDTGELYRVAQDGRFLVTSPGGEEEARKPFSKFEPGRETVSEQGLGRLRAALEQASFFSLPEQVATADCVPDGTVIRNSGRKVTRRAIVFSARNGDTVRTVEGQGDFAAPCTLAELEPIYRALDLDALGDWMNE